MKSRERSIEKKEQEETLTGEWGRGGGGGRKGNNKNKNRKEKINDGILHGDGKE